MNSYEPEVGDYVIWQTTTADKHDEGWVYFKCPELEENINCLLYTSDAADE